MYEIVQQVEAYAVAFTQSSITAPLISGLESGSLLFAVVHYEHSGGGVSCSFSDTGSNGANWVEIGTETYYNPHANAFRAFYREDTNNISNSNITVTFGVNVDFPGIYIAEITGLAASPLLAYAKQITENIGTGTDAVSSGASGSFLLNGEAACVFAFNSDTANDSLSAGTGYTALTKVWTRSGQTIGLPEHKRITADGTATGTATTSIGTNEFESVVVVFLEATTSVNNPTRQSAKAWRIGHWIR